MKKVVYIYAAWEHQTQVRKYQAFCWLQILSLASFAIGLQYSLYSQFSNAITYYYCCCVQYVCVVVDNIFLFILHPYF